MKYSCAIVCITIDIIRTNGLEHALKYFIYPRYGMLVAGSCHNVDRLSQAFSFA